MELDKDALDALQHMTTIFGDLIVDGVRMADTDFSQFTRECHLEAWSKRAKQAAYAAYGQPDESEAIDETLWAFGDYRRDLIDATEDRLREAKIARQDSCPARNLDLKVVRTFPKEWTAEDIEGNTVSCLIGLNDGRAPNEVVFADFLDAEEMTNYEFAAYDILGEEECDRQGIDTLYDMFGTEFATAFYKRKNQLFAQWQLKDLYGQRDLLNVEIARLEALAAD